MDKTYPISSTLWDIRWLRHIWHHRGTQRHVVLHTHLTLSRSRKWSRICTTTPVNLQHELSTLFWVATKHYRKYISWITAPPLEVWTPQFKAPRAHVKVGHHHQEFCKVWHPHMCSMHLRQVYLQTMAWALQKDPTQVSPNHQPGAESLCRPYSIPNSKASGKYYWHPQYQKIWVCHSGCVSLLHIHLHTPSSD